MSFECRPERPWGIHPIVFNDKDCPRCGWTAPGPAGDARAEAEAALALAGEPGWAMIEAGVPQGDGEAALAA